MKRHHHVWISLIIVLITLSACQSIPVIENITDTPSAEDTTILPDTTPFDEAYPLEDIVIPPSFEAAYPITEEDLSKLLRAWTLVTYSENGLQQQPEVKTLRFNADGSYEMITETGQESGNWTARLLAVESTLTLDPGTDEILTFEIVDLEEALLNLRSIRGETQIDEGYQPADW